MTDTPDPKEAVTDELTEQVDVGSLVTGDSPAEQVDGESLGRTFGESVGALAGRRLGKAAVGGLASKLDIGDDESDPSLLRRLGRAFVAALGRTLSKPEFRDPIEDALRGYVEQREAAAEKKEEAEETLDDAKETAEEAAEMAAETVESGDEESTEDETAESDSESGIDASDLTADDVQAIREETYRELLETMEYSELQSIAKEVGVKANLGQDEMVDAIVEEFNDSSGDAEDDEE